MCGYGASLEPLLQQVNLVDALPPRERLGFGPLVPIGWDDRARLLEAEDVPGGVPQLLEDLR